MNHFPILELSSVENSLPLFPAACFDSKQDHSQTRLRVSQVHTRRALNYTPPHLQAEVLESRPPALTSSTCWIAHSQAIQRWSFRSNQNPKGQVDDHAATFHLHFHDNTITAKCSLWTIAHCILNSTQERKKALVGTLVWTLAGHYATLATLEWADRKNCGGGTSLGM